MGFGELWAQEALGGTAGLSADAPLTQRPSSRAADGVVPEEAATLARWGRSSLEALISARDLPLKGLTLDAGYARRSFSGQPLVTDALGGPTGEEAPSSSSGERLDHLLLAAVSYSRALTLGPVAARLGLWLSYERNASNQGRRLAGRYQEDSYSFERLRLRPALSARWEEVTLAASYERSARDYAARRALKEDGGDAGALAADLSTALSAEARYALGEGAEVGLYYLRQSLTSNLALPHLFVNEAEVTQAGLLVRLSAE